MKVEFHCSYPKDIFYSKSNEDVYDYDESKGIVAVSDGASVSFSSKIWAELLVKALMNNDDNDDFLDDAILTYNSYYQDKEMPWYMEEAFKRGSFATMLRVKEIDFGKKIEMLCIGDSVAILLDGVKFVAAYLYDKSAMFKEMPELPSTIPRHNFIIKTKIKNGDHKVISDISRLDRPVILCMTDALGQWAMEKHENNENVWEILSNIDKKIRFKAFIYWQRIYGRIRVDDTTLIKITF